VLAEALDGAQALAEREDLAGLEEARSFVHAAPDAERDHAAKTSRLRLRNQMVGVRGEACERKRE
jgi:hypothetical protein